MHFKIGDKVVVDFKGDQNHPSMPLIHQKYEQGDIFIFDKISCDKIHYYYHMWSNKHDDNTRIASYYLRLTTDKDFNIYVAKKQYGI